MTKKYGKDTFRRSKKKILHKKWVNTKKRGLRGGDFIDTTPVIDQEGLHGIVGLKTPELLRKSLLSTRVCDEWLRKVKTNTNLDKAFDENGNIILTPNGRKDYDTCSRKVPENPLKEYSLVKKRAIEQGQKVQTGVELDFKSKVDKPELFTLSNLPEIEEKILNQERKQEFFDTTLTTLSKKAKRSDRSLKPETLTLKDCVAVRTPFRVGSNLTSHFEYSIYSSAVSTLPPIGGIQKETLVGTFTQLPVSFLLKLVGRETPFSFASFYRSNDVRASHFTDYIECLKNVKEKFGPDVTPTGGQHQESTFIGSSKLREFGKSEECKIVLVAGNIGTKIQDPANDGAMFSLASQLSATEYLDPESGPTTTLDNYKEDPTGGPIAQLSGSPPVANFILLHGARTGFNSNFLVINAIDDVISELVTLGITSLTLNNGYLEVPANLQSGGELDLTDSQNPPENAITIFDSLSTRLKVLQTDGVRADGLTPPGIYSKFNWESNTKVTLIYSSAVPLNYSPLINPEKSMLQYCVAGFDLVAQYFGAMVSAYHKSKKLGVALSKKVKLFLTALGGGVFQNPREMIASSVLLAYYQAQQLFSDFDAKVEIIFLVWDGNLFECSDFMKFFNEDGSITKLIEDKKIADKKEREKILKEQNEDQAALGQGQSPPTSFDVVEAEQLEKPPHDADAYADASAAEIQQNVNILPPEEAPPATMLGDDLYNKHEEKIPSRDVLANDETIKTYREQILSKLDQFTTTELDKDKICELFLISCNGSNLEQFKKLLFFREIFASEYCEMSSREKCHNIYIKFANEIIKLTPYYSLTGGSKSRRRHRHKPARKSTRKYKSKSKHKPKTHRRRRAHHSRTRKHKKYTSCRR